jgi:DNA-binding transcriptional ArsR family regulator
MGSSAMRSHLETTKSTLSEHLKALVLSLYNEGMIKVALGETLGLQILSVR